MGSQPVGSRPSPQDHEPIAVPPLPAGTAPDGCAVGAATANRRRVIHRKTVPSVPGQPERGLFDRRSTGCLDSRRLCFTLAPLPASRCARHGLDPSYPRYTKHGATRGQGALPPTSPSLLRPSLRPSLARLGRHHPQALPPKRRLPAGVHGPTREPLDLRATRLFTGDSSATHRLSASAT